MQHSIVRSQKTLEILPNDIKMLLIQFLAPADLCSLQYTSHSFFCLLKNNTKLWAKYLFIQCLAPAEEEEILFKSSFFIEKQSISEHDFKLEAMSDSRRIIQTTFLLKEKFMKLLIEFQDQIQIQNLVDYMFDAFSKPNYLIPYLKRDIHIFPTGSVFQNFLTEVYFGVQPRCCLTNIIQAIVTKTMENMKSSPNNALFNREHLLPLRWYCFDEISEPQGLLEEFFKLIYNQTYNHCKGVSSCLKAIQGDLSLLSDYITYWEGFVLTTIDLNQILLPVTKYLNMVYNTTYKDLPNFPEFSVWRMMTKIWYDNVFTPLSETLYNDFRKTIGHVRRSNGLFYTNQEDSKELLQNNAIDLEQNNQNILILLGRFYQAISDLSYDEFTIFFEKCAPVSTDTPLGRLNDLIVQDTSLAYESFKGSLFSQLEQVVSFLKADIDLTEKVFGKEITLKTQNMQRTMIIDHLENHSNSNVQYLELFNQEINKSSRLEIPRELCGLEAGTRTNIMPNLEFCMRIQYDKLNQSSCSRGGKKCHSLDLLVFFIDSLTEKIEHHYEECEEILQDIIDRGIEVIDQNYEGFFVYNKSF